MNTKAKKTALVTGASSGIGKEIAKQLISDGFTVYAAARRTDTAALTPTRLSRTFATSPA